MSKFTKKYILRDEITYLPMSDDFKRIADKMGLKTIRQILSIPNKEFREMEFEGNFMFELCELAEEYGFLGRIEKKLGF